jgi:nucleoside 2-deoxyribosyltransferase
MKIFFGGIIQGSKMGQNIHTQDYRQQIKDILKNKHDNIEVFDPFDGHEGSIHYNDDQARAVFFKHLEEVRSSDLLIAYLPEASLGTAIEIWEAYNRGIPILSISPLTTNWIIRFIPKRNFETIERFRQFIIENDIERLYSREIKESV